MKNFYRMSDSSFIICTKDRPDDMVKCIKSILDQTISPKELIVIDAGKTQKVEKLARGVLRGSRIDFIYQHTKPSLPYQRNIGVNLATGNIIFFFDDDVLLNADYHEKILNVYLMDKSKEVGGVTGVIKNPVQNPFLGKVFRRIFLLSERPIGEAKIKSGKRPNFKIGSRLVKPVNNMWGCQMSFRKEILDKYKFDEAMGKLTGYAFLEDYEHTSRVAREHILLQVLSAKVYHAVSPVGRESVEKLQEMTVLNTYYIFKKNVPKNLQNCLTFLWQQIGGILHSIAQTIREKNIGWIAGILKGYRDCFLSINLD